MPWVEIRVKCHVWVKCVIFTFRANSFSNAITTSFHHVIWKDGTSHNAAVTDQNKANGTCMTIHLNCNINNCIYVGCLFFFSNQLNYPQGSPLVCYPQFGNHYRRIGNVPRQLGTQRQGSTQTLLLLGFFSIKTKVFCSEGETTECCWKPGVWGDKGVQHERQHWSWQMDVSSHGPTQKWL